MLSASKERRRLVIVHLGNASGTMLSKETRIEGLHKCRQTLANSLETLNCLVAARHSGRIFAHLVTCSVEFEASILYQILYHTQLLHIFGSILPRAVSGAPRTQLRKFRLPKTQCRRRQPQHLGYLSYLIVSFVQVFHCNKADKRPTLHPNAPRRDLGPISATDIIYNSVIFAKLAIFS